MQPIHRRISTSPSPTDPKTLLPINHPSLETWKPSTLLRPIKRRPTPPHIFPLSLILLFLLTLLIRPYLSTSSISSSPTTSTFPLRPFSNSPSTNLTSIVLIALHPSDTAKLSQTLSQLRSQAPEVPVTLYHTIHSATEANRLSADDPVVTSVLFSSSRPYDAVLKPLTTTSGQPPLYVLAGTELSPYAFAWLSAARQKFSSRPDVAAFFLDGSKVRTRTGKGLDHESSTWTTNSVKGDAFLYQLCVGGSAFVPNWGVDLDVWATFAEWLTLRRADWYHYPEGMGVDGTPLGMAGVAERNWTRGGWNVWFSKFMGEYGMYAVYPSGVMAKHERLDFGRDMELPGVYGGNGNFEFEEEFERLKGDGSVGEVGKFGGVDKIVKLGKKQGGVVSFTMVNQVFLDTARSWLCNVDVGGFRPKGLLWAVTDVETREALNVIDGSEVVLLDEVKGGKETGHEFGNPGYWKLMLERTELIGEILRNGVAVFAFETDAIWLEDPAPYIEELVRQDADIVGTINTRMEVSGNFFYLRPTLATRRLWDEILTQFDSAYRNAGFEKKEATSWTYIENDQSQLTKLVLRNETWRRSYPLNFLTLDMERFTDGRWYKPEEGFYTSKRAREAVVINNNFVIGVGEKTTRAKKWGHWFWDEKEKKCLDSVVRKAVRESRKGGDVDLYIDGHDGAHKPRNGS